MIATGVSIVEPALTRLVFNLFGTFKILEKSESIVYVVSGMTIVMMFSVIIGLMVLERNQKKGRWVFPSYLGVFAIFYLVWLFEIHIGLQSFAKWFYALPLT
jgi:drug/metabolite transporter superfamily protein YnfA